MASSDSNPALPSAAPLSSKKENVTSMNSKIAELSESRSELLKKIQGLKLDLQTWRSKLDTQVNVYRDELSELKKSLNEEVEQLRSEFKELKTTLQQQQEDVTSSLRNLGLEDIAEEVKGTKDIKGEEHDEVQGSKVEKIDEEVHAVSANTKEAEP